jgi:hypothetical protein
MFPVKELWNFMVRYVRPVLATITLALSLMEVVWG